MKMGSSKFEKDLVTLSQISATTESLIRAFQTSHTTPTSSNIGPPPHPNPLAVLGDACKILKAQTTKLSLLLLNKPFTPSEIAHILGALNNSCLPALATTPDLCLGDKHTDFLRGYINSCLASIWTELRSLVGSIPRNKDDIEALGAEGTLQSTGVLWATCDKLISLAGGGLVPAASKAVKENQELLQDAINELDEWDPDDDDDDDDIDYEEDSGEERKKEPTIATPTTSEDEQLVEGVQKLNLNPIFALKSKALKHMRLVRLLYPALNKHRIMTFSNVTSSTIEEDLPSPSNVHLFDNIIIATQSFSEESDEIAAALYSGDTEEIASRVEILITKARDCATFSQNGYDGAKDGFSEWAEKWIARSEELSK